MYATKSSPNLTFLASLVLATEEDDATVRVRRLSSPPSLLEAFAYDLFKEETLKFSCVQILDWLFKLMLVIMAKINVDPYRFKKISAQMYYVSDES